jgi:1-aminocyclopropane-1-carboxylate deaminase
MITNPVYEGKSTAGLIDLIARGEVPRNASVLYAHLGGKPVLNAYSALFSEAARGTQSSRQDRHRFA